MGVLARVAADDDEADDLGVEGADAEGDDLVDPSGSDGLDDDGDVEEAEPAKKPKPEIRARRRVVSAPTAGTVMRREHHDDTKSTMQWFNEQAGSNQTFKIRVTRQAPSNGPNGENLAGVLEPIEERVPDLDDYLKEVHGGGRYQLQIMLPDQSGSMKYGKTTTVKIAGPPKVDGLVLEKRSAAEQPAGAANNGLADRAITGAERIANQERQRADRIERELADARMAASKVDGNAIAAALQPLQAEMAELRTQNRELNQQLLLQVAKPPPKDEFRDEVLKQAISGESQKLTEQASRFEQRMDKMRDDHAALIAQTRLSHQDDIKRLEHRHDTDMAEIRKANERQALELSAAHAREVKHLEKSHESEIKNLESSHKTRDEALDRELKRLQGDNAALKTELAAVRDKKDKSPIEQIKDMVTMKESLDILKGKGDDDDADKPWWEKAADALTPMAERVAERIMGGEGDDDEGDEPEQPAQRQRRAPPQQQQAQQAQHPAVNKALRHPEDGLIYIHRGNGFYEGGYTDEQFQQLVAHERQQNQQKLIARRRGQPQPQPRRAAQPAAAAPASMEDAAVAAADGGDAIADGLSSTVDAAPPPAPPGGRAQPNPRPGPQLAQGSQVQRQPTRQMAQARPQRPKGKPPSADQIKAAVTFLENAVRNNQDPEAFARTARNLIPGQTLAYLHSGGVDNLLEVVARSKPGSVLTTQAGQDFARQVVKHLRAGA